MKKKHEIEAFAWDLVLNYKQYPSVASMKAEFIKHYPDDTQILNNKINKVYNFFNDF